MNFTWFGNFVTGVLMKDMHKRCKNKINETFVEALSNLCSKAVSTLIFTVLVTSLITDIDIGNSSADHVFAIILLILALIAILLILFIVISVFSNYPIQSYENDNADNANVYRYIAVDIDDYHGKCCLDNSCDDDNYLSNNIKKLCERESKSLASFSVLAMSCSLIMKCVPHVLALLQSISTVQLSNIISAINLVLAIITETCKLEIFVVGLLGICFAVCGVVEKSSIKIEKVKKIFKAIEFVFIIASVFIIFFVSMQT